MTTKITDANLDVIANKFINWQSVITADGSTTTNLVAGRGYIIDTTSAAHTVNLPATATKGDTIVIKDYAGTFGTNAVTINRNGNSIQGAANNSELTTNRASVTLVYIDSTKGWLYTDEHNVGELVPTYISASGGTETTDGDYKIHTFTGDGCFVVSSLGGGGVPCAQASTVDYLVVAGGGGAGYLQAGGGGAGGYRESKDSTLSSPHTASPLAATSGLTITATTYPITVGGGGAGRSSPAGSGIQGSNSVFSTITSAGGGAGGPSGPAGSVPGGTGGSGGGGGENNNGGAGNTPPVSPPQGNNGGNGAVPHIAGGGGGGAGAVGSPSPSNLIGGAGGNGVQTSINGSATYYAGGGGGGPGDTTTSPSGGLGGGGPASSGGGTPGTANTGGGGGSNDFPVVPGTSGGSGGKGIVIIRYKYQ